ncbi:MAG TPA: PEGA domain-containing protein [Myxococcales bacterium]|nr:PEGA domain-containing protein [Myxococcales bacterium]HIN85603.1 PEGA domain-containing protein [Myxococcales bacterium]
MKRSRPPIETYRLERHRSLRDWFKVVLIVQMLAALFVVLPATAQKSEKQANKLYNEGKILMDNGDVKAAIARFDGAWAAFKHPLIIKKRAEAHKLLFQYEESIADYQTYLTVAKRIKSTEKEAVLAPIATMKEMLSKPVQVSLTTGASGVRIKVDGGSVLRTPITISTTPGKHNIAIVDERYMSMSKERRVFAGKPDQVLKLQAIPKTGSVVFITDRDSFNNVQVLLDSVVINLAPQELDRQRMDARQLVIGEHKLLCSSPGLPSYYTSFTVTEGEISEVSCDFASVSSGLLRDTWGWVTLSSGLVGVVAGSAFLISYGVDQDTAESSNKELVTSKDTAGAILLGLGAVLSVSSYFVFTRHRKVAASSKSQPVFFATPLKDGGFVSATLRF